jgi:CheY-like chemotaxis protein
MKILVAEDNAVTATLMTGVLTRAGYSVVLAPNGSEALGLLRCSPDIQGVINDIMMPESSGLDLLQALRAHQPWRKLPTIVITVRDDAETVEEATPAVGSPHLTPAQCSRLLDELKLVQKALSTFTER